MPTRKRSTSRKPAPANRSDYDVEKFENVHQIAGIRTAQLAPGTADATHVALVDTGSGLRFTVALDRGGDIVEAFYHQHSLTYLTPQGIRRPSHAYHQGLHWLFGWPGGLMTTCGPVHIGRPVEGDETMDGLHGHHSNLPATVEMLINPDPHRGRNEMLLTMVIWDSRMFGPSIEVRRTIQCAVGQSHIHVYDQVTNRGNQRCPHDWLYHVNFGYPFLNVGAQFIYRGKATYFQAPETTGPAPSDAALNRMKRVVGALPEHEGMGERGMIVEPKADASGQCHVGMINRRLGLGIELSFPREQLPRVANWQHYGPHGSYVSAVEPFRGSLMGRDGDDHPSADEHLDPGETRRYQMAIHVHATSKALDRFQRYDGPVKAVK